MKVFSILTAAALAIPTVMGYHISDSDHGIVGGADAVPGAFPWLGMISGGWSTLFQRQFCDGFFIAEDVFVTAGHCTHVYNNKQITISSHRFNQTKSTEEEGGIDFNVLAQVRHPEYNNKAGYPLNDIAVWFIDVRKNYAGKTTPVVNIQQNPKLPAGHGKLIIAGWGTTESGGEEPEHLQVATVKTINNKKCSAAYKTQFPNSILCAGIPEEGGIDTCQGDSGGPIFRKEGKDYVVQGIVSFGYGCADGRYPGVYTRISQFIPWVQEVVANKAQHIASDDYDEDEDQYYDESDNDDDSDPDYVPESSRAFNYQQQQFQQYAQDDAMDIDEFPESVNEFANHRTPYAESRFQNVHHNQAQRAPHVFGSSRYHRYV